MFSIHDLFLKPNTTQVLSVSSTKCSFCSLQMLSDTFSKILLQIISSFTPKVFPTCPPLVISFLPQNTNSPSWRKYKFLHPEFSLPVHSGYLSLPHDVHSLPWGIFHIAPQLFPVCPLLISSFFTRKHSFSTLEITTSFTPKFFPTCPLPLSSFPPQYFHSLPYRCFQILPPKNFPTCP